MDFGTLAGVGGIFVAVVVSMVLEGSSPASILLLPALFLVFDLQFIFFAHLRHLGLFCIFCHHSCHLSLSSP